MHARAKGERSETAWRNYHLLVEVAKKRAEAAHEHKSALFVELHSTTEPDVVCQLGYGLPISRAYARYFGGDLNLMSMEGYGTDAFLHLPRLGNRDEPLH